jgi:hypothetical protein
MVTTLMLLIGSPAKASVGGDYQQGRQDGRDAARNDFPSFNNHCENTISYCAGYELAYGKMWSNLNEVNKK